MASEESFSRVLRGYDPAEVDPLIQKLRRELLSAKSLHDDSIAQLKQLEARLAELELESDVKVSPTIEGLSTALNNKLKKADKLAAEIVRRAESDALLIRSAAEKTANQFVDAAREGFEQTRAEAQQLSDQLTAQAREEAQRILAEARAAAENIFATGQSDAQHLRGEASTIAANLRAESHNEIARLKADAQREIEELKLVLTSQTNPEITINDKIMSILKLNADGAAIRAEMEAELQIRHQESVLQTEKYVGAAEAQLATARTRQRAIESECERLEAQAAEEAKLIVDQARQKAAVELDSAQKLARKKINDAEKYVAAVISSIYTQIDGLRVEREAVASFFDALRLELEHSLGESSPQKKLTTKR